MFGHNIGFGRKMSKSDECDSIDLSLKNCLTNQITPIINVIPVMTLSSIFSDIRALIFFKAKVFYDAFLK